MNESNIGKRKLKSYRKMLWIANFKDEHYKCCHYCNTIYPCNSEYYNVYNTGKLTTCPNFFNIERHIKTKQI
jgi:hypothetical protein